MKTNPGGDRANLSVTLRLKRLVDLIAEREQRPRTIVIERALRAYVAASPELREQEPTLRHGLGL